MDNEEERKRKYANRARMAEKLHECAAKVGSRGVDLAKTYPRPESFAHVEAMIYSICHTIARLELWAAMASEAGDSKSADVAESCIRALGLEYGCNEPGCAKCEASPEERTTEGAWKH